MAASVLKKWVFVTLHIGVFALFVACLSTSTYAFNEETNQQILTEYENKHEELEQYKDLFDLLKEQKRKDEVVLDAALYVLVDKKITALQEEVTVSKDRLLKIPFHYILENRLPEVDYDLENVNMDEVKQAWLSWVNKERTTKWLKPFVYSKVLDNSAQIWAEELAHRYGSHRRPGSLDTHERTHQKKNGYDHAYLGKWFADHGIKTIVRGSSNYTENTWYGWYFCDKDDCTDTMTNAIKSTFNYYMKEKRWMPSNSMRTAHYRSLVSGNYQYIGMWLVCVDSKSSNNYADRHWCTTSSQKAGRYWLVIHYATDFVQPVSFKEVADEWYAEFMPL